MICLALTATCSPPCLPARPRSLHKPRPCNALPQAALFWRKLAAWARRRAGGLRSLRLANQRHLLQQLEPDARLAALQARPRPRLKTPLPLGVQPHRTHLDGAVHCLRGTHS